MLHRGNITITGLEEINRHPTVSVLHLQVAHPERERGNHHGEAG